MFISDTLNPFLKGYFRPLLMNFADEAGSAGAGDGDSGDADSDSGDTGSDTDSSDSDSGGDAGGDGSWFDGFSDEIRNDPTVRKYKSSEELAKAHINLQSKIGAKGVIVPKEGATQEEYDAFYEKLGRPKTSDEYKFTPIENLHESIKITSDGEKAFKDIAHKIGLSQVQADALNKWYLSNINASTKNSFEEQDKALKSAEATLRQDWGQGYEQRIKLAQRVVDKFGGEEAKSALKEVGNNPAVLKMLAEIGSKMSEDSIGDIGGGNLLMTASQAKQKIAEMANDKTHPVWDESHPMHKEAVEERTRLYKLAYPDEDTR